MKVPTNSLLPIAILTVPLWTQVSHALSPRMYTRVAKRGQHRTSLGMKLEQSREGAEGNLDRRCALKRFLVPGMAALPVLLQSSGASAKVQGYAPPQKSLSEEYRQGTAALADVEENASIPREAYQTLPSGLILADVRKGSGDQEVKPGSKVNLQWVLRKSNGYFVDSSSVSDGVPFIFTVGDPKGAIAGVDEGVRGMKTGGVRRLLIPPSLAYVEGVEDGLPGPLPVGFGPRQQIRRVMNFRKDVPGEYLYLEVQATKIR